ncbi:conserved hypothetical protein [Trichinella spiralis]|uniref:hypothetical protein n=1 Tax=Trichinella spiralis TaxID=6334 RepID=UPI0001EFCE71|nr:conserved hypothetical protein [Trichinella spiralis]
MLMQQIFKVAFTFKLYTYLTFFGNRQRLLKLNEQKTGAIECHVSFPLTPMCTMGISVADRGTEQPLGGSFNVPSVILRGELDFHYAKSSAGLVGIHFYCHCSPVCSSTKKAIVASVWWPACFWTNGQLNPPCGADTSRHNSVYCDKNVSVSMRQNRPRSSLDYTLYLDNTQRANILKQPNGFSKGGHP